MPDRHIPAELHVGSNQTATASTSHERWHFRAVACGSVVTTLGPEPIRDRYLRAFRQWHVRRVEGTPATPDQLQHDQGVQYEGLVAVQAMQVEIARYPTAAAGELGQAARELIANIQLGGQAGIGPTDLARLWDRVEGGLVGLREAAGTADPVSVIRPGPVVVETGGVQLRQADGSYSGPHALGPQPLLVVRLVADAWAAGRPATRTELLAGGVSDPRKALHQAVRDLPALRPYLRMPGRVGRPTVGSDVEYSLIDPHDDGHPA